MCLLRYSNAPRVLAPGGRQRARETPLRLEAPAMGSSLLRDVAVPPDASPALGVRALAFPRVLRMLGAIVLCESQTRIALPREAPLTL